LVARFNADFNKKNSGEKNGSGDGVQENPGFFLEVFEQRRQVVEADFHIADNDALFIAGAVIDIEGIAVFVFEEDEMEGDSPVFQVGVDLVYQTSDRGLFGRGKKRLSLPPALLSASLPFPSEGADACHRGKAINGLDLFFRAIRIDRDQSGKFDFIGDNHCLLLPSAVPFFCFIVSP
jgi:hypothetical protein